MRYSIGVVLCCMVLAACAGSRAGTDPRPDEPGPDGQRPEETVVLADVEDFDPGPYREAAPGEVELEHDVPPSLMEGRADESATRTVQGYRVQVSQTQDKSAADDALAQALGWWREQADQPDALPVFRLAQPPVYILYRQPYYRVRVGNFTTREDATRFLSAVRQRFPSALVVPDAVTVRQ